MSSFSTESQAKLGKLTEIKISDSFSAHHSWGFSRKWVATVTPSQYSHFLFKGSKEQEKKSNWSGHVTESFRLNSVLVKANIKFSFEYML